MTARVYIPVAIILILIAGFIFFMLNKQEADNSFDNSNETIVLGEVSPDELLELTYSGAVKVVDKDQIIIEDESGQENRFSIIPQTYIQYGVELGGSVDLIDIGSYVSILSKENKAIAIHVRLD